MRACCVCGTQFEPSGKGHRCELRALVESELSEEYRCICHYGGRGEGGCNCGSEQFWEVVDREVERRMRQTA